MKERQEGLASAFSSPMLVSRAAHVIDGGRRYETKPSRAVLMSLLAILAEIVKRQRTRTAKRDDFISIS